MTNFVSGNNDTAETTGVFNDSHTVHFFQAFIHNASTANVCEAYINAKVNISKTSLLANMCLLIADDSNEFLNCYHSFELSVMKLIEAEKPN